MLINRLLSIFCLAALLYIVVGMMIASANPEKERSQKWADIMFVSRWILLVAFLVLLALKFIFGA